MVKKSTDGNNYNITTFTRKDQNQEPTESAQSKGIPESQQKHATQDSWLPSLLLSLLIKD